MKSLKSRWYDLLIIFGVIFWVLLSSLAIGGLYKLWWKRDYAYYFSKSLSQQRSVVWQKAGLSEAVLDAVGEVGESWPLDITYRLEGDNVNLSYAKYLLAPRVPSLVTESHYFLSDGGKFFPKDDFGNVNRSTLNHKPNVFGWLISVFCLSGIALAVRCFLRNEKVSLPEAFGLSLLLTLFYGLTARLFTSSSSAGFFFLAFSGVVGWLYFFSYKRECFRFFELDNFITRGARYSKKRRLLLGFTIFIILSNVLWSLLMSVIVVPDDWDAWAIWGAKAKVLALGNGPLADVIPFGHGDYPLLWPAVWAFSGFCSGDWEELWSRGWGSVFFLLCLWEIAVIIREETNRLDLALLGAALFSSVPMVPLVVSWSYAEAPLWLLSISCFGVLLRWQRNGSFSLVVIAALLAVGVAYTKNDGVLFVVLMLGWILLQKKEKRFFSFILFSLIFSLGYSPWVYWVKYMQGLGSHATAGLSLSGESFQHAWARIPSALEAILKMWGDIRQWSVVLWGVGIAWLFLVWRAKDKATMLMPVLLSLGFFTIIVFHPAEIFWQVGTSWNRLTLQFLPLLIIVVVIEFNRLSIYQAGRQ